MKKKLFVLTFICALAMAFSGCGKNENGQGGFLANLGKTETNLTIESIDSGMIEAGYYGESEDASVICGFIGLSDGQGICILAISENGTVSVSAGKYEPESRTDEDGVEITNIKFIDVFSGSEKTLGFVQEMSVSDNSVSTCVITDGNAVYDLYKTDSADFVSRMNNIGISSYNQQTVITTWMN